MNGEVTGPEPTVSDADLVERQDKTQVYFTDGCQQFAGELQYTEFDRGMQEFWESYYEWGE